MGCSQMTFRQMRTLWTQRSTTAVFLPLHEDSAMRFSRFKLDYNLQENLGSLEVRRAIRYSNDGGATWSTPTEFGTFSSTEGWDHHDTFEPISDDYQAFQAGLMVKNDTGSDQRFARLEIVLGLATAAR